MSRLDPSSSSFTLVAFPSRNAMQLIYFVAILVTLLARHVALMPSYAKVAVRSEVIAALALCFAFIALIAILQTIYQMSRQIDVGGRMVTSLRAVRTFGRYRSAMQWIWVLAFPIMAPIAGWPQWLHREWPTNLGLSVEFLGGVLPTITVFVWLDCLSFTVEQRALANVGKQHDGQLGLGRYVWLHVQHSWMLVLPFALISCLTFDAVRWRFPQWNEMQQASVVGCVSILLAQFLAPAILSKSWHASKLPCDDRYRHLWKRWTQLGLQHCPILLWSTQRRMANAVVVGVLPGQQRLYLTECLIERTSPEELELIVMHEASHVLRHHAWIRCLPMLVAFGAMMMLAYLIDHSSERTMAVVFDWIWIASIGFGVAMIWGLGALARWSERDADRYAITLATRLRLAESIDQSDEREATIRRQAERDLISALITISPDGRCNARSWLYPSVADRVRWIEKGLCGQDDRAVTVIASTGCNG